MITAFFQGNILPVVAANVPPPEVIELAKAVGMTESDLFGIDIPSGASRTARVRCLLTGEQVEALYNDPAIDENPSSVFMWQTSDLDPLHQLSVWLMPPRPLHASALPIGTGPSRSLYVVEAVDVRHWWRLASIDSLIQTPGVGPLFSSDGWWNTNGYDISTATPLGVMTAISAAMASATGYDLTIPGGFNPPAILMSRLADHRFPPSTSLALAADICASAFGWCIQWDSTSSDRYELVEIGDDAHNLDSFMAETKRGMVGGTMANTVSAAPADDLLKIWQSDPAKQANAFPPSVSITHPYRSVEGKTRYANTNNFPADCVDFSRKSEFGWQHSVVTSRPRTTKGVSLLQEPRPLVASTTTTFDPANPSTSLAGTARPNWDYTSYHKEIIDLLEARTTVCFGKTVWAGWYPMPFGSYRSTMLRYSLCLMGGQYVPVTLTEAAEDDWILGPSGVPSNDPTLLLFAKGDASARRLPSGATLIESPAPNTRVFAARITAFSSHGSPNIWRWDYSFVEVEVNPDHASTTIYSPTPRQRTGDNNAHNLMEAGNTKPTAVAPGVLASDYPLATIEALPIAVGSIVAMVEAFPTMDANAGFANLVPDSPKYWFSCPNAVKVACVE